MCMKGQLMTKPRKRKSASDRKAEIVQTAIRLAANYGPDRITTQHLADEIGVTQPAIFRHFATKSDIWSAVGDHIVEEVATLHAHPIDFGQVDPHDMLQEIVGQHFLHVTNNPAIPTILFSRELHAENGSLREKFTQLLNQRLEAITALIRHAQSKGLHRKDFAAEDAANLVMAAMQGLSMRWILEDRAFDLAEEGKRVLGALVDGFRP